LTFVPFAVEPLLHRDLTRIVEYAKKLDLHPWLTTNGILLKEKIDELYNAGLRDISVGYYGTGEEYDAYVQRKDRYALLERGIAFTRERYGLDVQFSVMRSIAVVLLFAGLIGTAFYIIRRDAQLPAAS
jgi:MoaA/NifB/PqqE/SkfB family radical SAM enzyme